MTNSFTCVSLNTESGGRPGFKDALSALVTEFTPDVIALQEVHHARDNSVPEYYEPINPGKREHSVCLRLHNNLMTDYSNDYVIFFAAHLSGLHDLEACTHNVAFGQTLMIRRNCSVEFTRSDFIYGRLNQFNTEADGGTPAGKVALGAKIIIASGEKIVLTNVHGFWTPRGKVDCHERYEQNQGINHHLKRMLFQGDTQHVLCVGDLNYRSDMRALQDLQSKLVFGSEGGVVLNHQFDVQRTRTDYYRTWQAEPEADFMIASPALSDRAVTYKPLLDFPSDHAPLVARFKF